MKNLLLFLSTIRPKVVVNKQNYSHLGQKRALLPSLLDRYLVGRFYFVMLFFIALLNSATFGQAVYNASLPCQSANATAASLTKATVTYPASTSRAVSGGANSVITEAWQVKADVNGQLGFFHGIRVTYGLLNTSCLDITSNSRQFALYDYAGNVCSGSSITPYFVNDGITNTQTTGAETNTMNPAWTGLNPNGDYVVIVRTTVGSNCTAITNTYGAYYGNVTNVPVTLCGQTVFNTGSGGFATAALAVADNGVTGSTNYNIAPTTTFKQVATVKSDPNGTLGVINYLQVLAPTAILATCSNNTRITRTGTEQLYLKDPLTGECTGSAIPKMKTGTNSSSFNPEWVGLTPNTDYIIIFTTTVDAQCTNYNKSNVAYYGAVTPQFTFNCSVSSVTGTFVHGTSSNGSLTIALTGATAGATTFNVTGTGFTGTLSTTLTAGQSSVTIPITYDGIAATGSHILTVTSPSGGGTCSKSVTVTNPPLTASTPTAKTAITNEVKTGTASTELSPVGGNGSYVYSVDASGSCTPIVGATALPIGSNLTVTNSTTGAYTFTAPAVAGTYYYCIKVCDTSTPSPVCITKTYTLTVSLPPCLAGTTAPTLSANTKSNVCPATTADLSSLVSSSCPVGSTLEWHNTNTGLSAANKVATPASVGAGTYYPVCFDAVNTCYSPVPATGVTVTITACCASGTIAPTLSATTKSNVCPATTADLSSLVSSSCPVGSILEWHNTNTGLSAANKVATPASVGAGTYYPVCFDAINTCYSPAPATGVTVTIANCITCIAGNSAPIISATTVTNTCPTTTFSLVALANTGTQPVGTSLVWSTHKVPTSAGDTLTNLATVAAAGKYYVLYFDKISNCYSPADSVTATLTICAVNPPAQTANNGQAKTGNAATELTPTSGTGAYVYSVDNSGSCTPVVGATALPTASNLTVTNSATGAYTYTAPTTAGVYYYCIKICDSATPTASCITKTYTLTVTCPVGSAVPSLK